MELSELSPSGDKPSNNITLNLFKEDIFSVKDDMEAHSR